MFIMSGQKKIIFDCDNTMGVKGCDVDDGLALLYLLGEGNREICGITTTYGNSDIETVYHNTSKMLQEIGRPGINLFKGCPNPGVLESEAADFIVETVNAYPGQISILATGSLTNLRGAYLKDQDIFTKIPQIVLMGGITQKLIINGKVLDELNFSCDPAATALVLEQGNNMSVITGNHCLDAYFSGEEFAQKLKTCSKPVARYIWDKCNYWFEDMMETFELDGFHNWDVVAAAYLIRPELFDDKEIMITPNVSLLKQGWLVYQSGDRQKSTVNTPKIKNINSFKERIYNAWLSVEI